MAVVSVNETMPWGAGGDFSIRDSVDSLTLTRSFVVILDGSDSNEDAPYVALAAPGLPNKGDSHPDSGYSDTRCRDITIELTESWKVFVVVCEYSTSTKSASRHGAIDPVNDPWDINFPNATSREIVEKTLIDVTSGTWAANETALAAGEPVTNAAGDWFDPGKEETIYPGRIVCSKNVNIASISFQEIMEYRGSINTETIEIAGYLISKWEGRLTGFSADLMDERGKLFYKITYSIDLKEDLWVRRIRNEGLEILKGDGSGDRVRATVDGDPIVSQMPLSVDGKSLVDKDNANYLVMGLIKGKNWNLLTTVPPDSLPSA